ncbi:TolC family protein [Sulfurospirillum sp. 1307]
MKNYKLVYICLIPVFAFANKVVDLPMCIHYVKQNNNDIAIAEENIKLDFVKLDKLKASLDKEKKPSIEFNSEYKNSYNHGFGNDSLTTSLTFTYNIASYLNRYNSLNNFSLNADRLKKDIIYSYLTYNTKTNYYNLLRAKKELEVLKKQKKLLEELRYTTTVLVKAEINLQSDIYKVDNTIDSIENQIFSKEHEIASKQSYLRDLINQKDDVNFKDIVLDFSNTENISSFISHTEENSPQIKSLNFELDALLATNIKKDSSIYPSFYIKTEQEKFFAGNTSDNYNIYAGVNIPLFTTDVSKYDKQIKRISINKKRLEISKKVKAIKRDVKKLSQSLQFNKNLYKKYIDTYEKTKATYNVLHVEYKNGLNTNIGELINIQKDILQAKLKSLEVFYDYKINLAKLHYYNGDVK